MTDPENIARLSDSQVLALTLWGEGRGEAVEGRIAIACLIRNRVTSKRFGASYREVCLKKWQFSCWMPQGGAANYVAVMSATANLLGPEPVPAMLRECLWIANGVMLDAVTDRVKGSTHYYSPEAMTPKGTVPKWAEGQPLACAVGRHLFYRGIA
jgi:N-acetylmuramoyl-L-alanine amidase